MRRVLAGVLVLSGCGPSIGDDDGPPVARTCGEAGPVALGSFEAGAVVRLDDERLLVVGYDDWWALGDWDVRVVDECGRSSLEIPAADEELTGALPGVAGGHLLACGLQTGGIRWYDPKEPGRSHRLFPEGTECDVYPVADGLATVDARTGAVWFRRAPERADVEAVRLEPAFVSAWDSSCLHDFDECVGDSSEPPLTVLEGQLWIPTVGGEVVAYDPDTGSTTTVLAGMNHYVVLDDRNHVLWEQDGDAWLYDRAANEHRSMGSGRIPFYVQAEGPWVSRWDLSPETELFDTRTHQRRTFEDVTMRGSTPDGRAIVELADGFFLLPDLESEPIRLAISELTRIEAAADGAVLVDLSDDGARTRAYWLANGSTEVEPLTEETMVQRYRVLADGTFVAHEAPDDARGPLVAYRDGARTVLAEDVERLLSDASDDDEVFYVAERTVWRIAIE